FRVGWVEKGAASEGAAGEFAVPVIHMRDSATAAAFENPGDWFNITGVCFRMAKTIVDAVLGLSFDDSSSNLAAATLFYILTNDSLELSGKLFQGQDDHLLDSPSCILFLLKLLKPLASDATKCKAPTVGCRLLALRKDTSVSQDNKGVDSTSAAIMLRVQEILVSCKEMKSRNENDDDKEKPELSPKWIALLTMEKACLSTISLEETTGTVRKSGGNFKEKLREHGGLDTVFEVAGNCRDVMKKWLEEHSCSVLKSKDNLNSESLVVLLKCLKIMENATFLSQNNQSHLLGMRGNFDYQQSPQSFTDLILSVIEILSGVSLLVHSSGSSKDGHTFELPAVADSKGVDYSELLSISSSMRSCSMDVTSSHSSQNLVVDLSRFSQSSSEATTTFVADTNLLKMRAGSSSGTSSSLNSGIDANSNGSWMNFGFDKRSKDTGDTKQFMVDSQDPFAFDEDELEPSKWDLLSRRKEGSQAQKRRVVVEDHDDVCQPLVISAQQESSNMEIPRSCEASCLSAIDVEKSNFLSDCLLTAVKVLMNLTNDNPIGCQQIAASGGLETLSSLIAVHFPSFSSYSPSVSELRQNILSFNSEVEVAHQNDRHLTDQELDFLVAILGLLVNLVEKDGENRSRLATARVSVPSLDQFEDEGRSVISLLCSIFLANQGAGEAAGEGKQSPSDDEDAEDAVLQGEKEAEKMIVEAYSALLLAFISTESKSIRNAIAECLPDHNLSILVPVLERFVTKNREGGWRGKMGDRFFHNEMAEYLKEAGGTRPSDGTGDGSLLELLCMPYPELAERFKEAALDLKKQIVKETWESSGKCASDFTLYKGVLGAAFLLFKSYQVTSNKEDLYLCSAIVKACDSASLGSKYTFCVSRVTFVYGRAGICALGAVAAKHASDEDLLKYYLAQFQDMKLPKDIPNELCFGRGGYLWACSFLNKHIGHGTIPSLQTAEIVKEMIMDGRQLSNGGRFPLMYEWNGKKHWGSAHGLAGIMQVLMEMELKPDEVEDVKGTLNYMIENRFPSGNYLSSEGNEADCYVHWCHGAPGVAITLVRAAEVFGEEFLQAAVDAGEVVWNRGLLKRVGICHGVSGNAYVFLSLYRLTGNEEFLHRAKAFACFLLDRGEKLMFEGKMHGGDQHYSLFEGIGGMAYLFLDMVNPSEARFPAYEL
ncbi:hypothetical protein RJ640_030135, partial [Escallonia rubra]